MKSGKAFLGILAGASAGTLLGLLFAPQTGMDTRKKITKTSKKYADRIKGEFNDTLNDITKRFKKETDELSEFTHKAKVKEEKLRKGNGVKIS